MRHRSTSSRSSSHRARGIDEAECVFINVLARFCSIMGCMTTKPMLILIAGPYRSGTGDDPARIAANLARLEAASWPIFQAGHVPMIGEWVALPVLRGAEGSAPASSLAERILYPTAERLLEHCDAVLRLPGDSRGADQDVAIARERGIPVYFDLDEVPQIDSSGAQQLPSEPGGARPEASTNTAASQS